MPLFMPISISMQGMHLKSRSGIFPRLHASVEEVKAKLSPVHTELSMSLKAFDAESKGVLSNEAVQTGLKQSGVFLSQADVDTLLNTVPRNANGDLVYTTLLDSLVGKSVPTGVQTARPTLDKEFSWPDGHEVFIGGLRLHATSQPFTVSPESMQRSETGKNHCVSHSFR